MTADASLSPLTSLLLWQDLTWPLLRLLLGMATGLLLASVLEVLNWTRPLARLAIPLAHAAHLRDVAGAAFSLSFVSPAAANALLSASHQRGELPERELMLANIFNSLPAYLVHTPSIFFLTWPVLGLPALVYVGLTLLAAAGRTVFAVALSRSLLPLPVAGCNVCDAVDSTGSRTVWKTVPNRAWLRFLGRLPCLALFTVPIYVLMFFMQRHGLFDLAENWLAEHMSWLSFLRPEALGVIVLHLAAELGAALGAAGSLVECGGLSAQDVVLALMVGNILSTPMRAIRHQFPAYAGFFSPGLALRLILVNQGLRAGSMIVVTMFYYYFCMA